MKDNLKLLIERLEKTSGKEVILKELFGFSKKEQEGKMKLVKPFKMMFDLSFRESNKFNKIVSFLLNKGYEIQCYNKEHNFLILEGLYFKTCNFKEFKKSPLNEVEYDEFINKYKIK
jgi:hypothetical protein